MAIMGSIDIQFTRRTTYTWVRYADDSTGNGMSNYPDGKKYIGMAYNQPSPTESNNPADYAWSLIQGDKGEKGDPGEDAWKVEIISSNGNIFKSGNINTVLDARVYKGGVDITEEIPIANFKWQRVSSDPEGDIIWNDKYFGGTRTIVITTEDVYRRATFFCEVNE